MCEDGFSDFSGEFDEAVVAFVWGGRGGDAPVSCETGLEGSEEGFAFDAETGGRDDAIHVPTYGAWGRGRGRYRTG